jgi:hypothetical protein
VLFSRSRLTPPASVVGVSSNVRRHNEDPLGHSESMHSHYLIYFSSTGLTAIVVYLVGEQLGWPSFRDFLLHPSTAAWVQAIGSIGAIVAATWVVRRQHLLERQRAQEEEVRKRAEVVNGTTLVLIAQVEMLLSYKRQILDPQKSNPAKHLAVAATQVLNASELAVDRRQLAFLVETPAHDLLTELLLAHDTFHTAIQAVNDRTIFHRTEFQPRLEASGLNLELGVAVEQIERAVGIRITHTLRVMTTNLEEMVDLAVSRLTSVGPRIPQELKPHFLGARIIGFHPTPQ